jgi:hypothetical protein
VHAEEHNCNGHRSTAGQQETSTPGISAAQLQACLLGNSGKPDTLETLTLTKFLRCVFQSLEPAKLQIREHAKFGDRGSEVGHGVADTRKPGISGWRWREPRRAIDSGIFRGSSSEVMHGDIHEPAKKQSQSCRPKKSRF